MADINLLPQEEKSAENIELLRKRLTVVSIVLLVGVSAFTLVTLGLFTSFASKRSNLISKVEQISGQINSFKATEELVVVVKGKVSSAEKVLSSRINYSNIFDQLSQLVPAGVYFSDMKFSSGKLIVSGKAKSSADVAGLVSSLVSGRGAQIVSNVTIDSLSADDSGVYSFIISSQLVASN